jgi:hypothetical protein
MAQIEKSVVSLRIIGDFLMPDEITKMLGAPPTKSQIKGETLHSKNTDKTRIAKFGMWRLDSANSEPENLDGQIKEVLGKLTDNLEIWFKIREQFEVDFFCGLFMGVSNEGLSLSPQTLADIGLRGIELGLDIYGPVDEPETN